MFLLGSLGEAAPQFAICEVRLRQYNCFWLWGTLTAWAIEKHRFGRSQ